MAIDNNADYTLKGSQVLNIRDYVYSAIQLPTTVIGSGAPTSSTDAEVGQLYYDTVNDSVYYCKAKTPQGTDPETYVYTWGALSTSSQVQGVVINGGTTAPTTSTVGAVGTMYNYVDTTGLSPEPHLMICTAVTTSGNTTTYTWTDVMGTVAAQLNVINNGSNV